MTDPTAAEVVATQFVAEVSSNHSRDLGRALAFVDAAADCGCSGVKFQLFRVRELFAPEILERSPRVLDREAWELPLAFLDPISQRARDRGLQFLCTPFYLEAVGRLEPCIDVYKVASYELLWSDLLTACAATGKPVVLSTGMATMGEIETAVRVLQDGGCGDLTLLHCVSSYPAPPAECNLAAIATLREAFGCKVGWSDHTVDAGIVDRAVHRWDADMVEFHLDLDRHGDEYASGHCWLPDEIAPVIRNVRTGAAADGSGEKSPAPCEAVEREWRADPADGLRPLRHIRENWTP